MPCNAIYGIFKPYRYRVYELFSLADKDLEASRLLFASIRRDFRTESAEREAVDPDDRIAMGLRRALATKHVTGPTATEYQLRRWSFDASVALSQKNP